MDMVIREATPDDAAALAALLTDLGYPADVGSAGTHIARFSALAASRLLVAERDGRVVGVVGTSVVPRLDDDMLSCRITNIVVSPSDRRSGVGSGLVAAVEREARRTGVPRLDLSSGDWRTEAHAFYSRLGFRTRSRSFTKRLGPP